MSNIKTASINDLRDQLDQGSISSDEMVSEYLSRIEKQNDNLNAFLSLYKSPVQEKSEKSLPLSGIPIAVKDNILIEGEKVSAGSKILEDYTATYDATAASKLKKAGAVILGRTNMDEFAMGSSTEHSAFGATKNPLDVNRTPGGSSGGSAAAVAAGLVPAALGSDTAGSIRQPASFCGVVGLKPTYGAVSRHGLIALGSSLDQIGPITRTVTDAETLFHVLYGHDPLDSTTLPDSVWHKAPSNKTSTVGIPWSIFNQKGVSEDVKSDMKHSEERLKELGYAVKEIDLPNLSYALSVYYIILPAEASANLARFDGVRYGFSVDGQDLLADYEKTRGVGFGSEVKRRIMLGTYVLSSGYYDAYYRTARAARQMIRQELTNAFDDVDIIALPTTPTPAFRLGEKVDDPLSMYMADIFTVPANVAGVPALSVPSGTAQVDGVELPLGLQFMGPMASEGRLFEIGKRFLGEK